MFKFTLSQIEGTDEAQPLNADANDSVLRFSSLMQIPTASRFTRMGGWSVSLRASIIRLAFMKLLGTGVLAALGAVFATSREAAFACALAAAVNTVACFHYYLIWSTRAQVVPDAYDRFVSRPRGSKTEAEQDAEDEVLLLAQEHACDALRHSDWAVHAFYSNQRSPHICPFPRPSTSPGAAATFGYVLGQSASDPLCIHSRIKHRPL